MFISSVLCRALTLATAAIALISYAGPCQAEPLTWSPPAPLSEYGAFDAQHEMSSWSASNGNGIIVTVYENAGGLAGSRSIDGGQSWSHVFGSTAQGAVTVVDASVVYAGTQTFVVTFIGTTAEGTRLYTLKSEDNGLTWSAPVIIPSDNSGSDIDAASDGNGGIIFTVRSRLYKSPDFGDTWTSTGLFAQQNPYFQTPNGSRIAHNGDGKWVHVYHYWQNYGIGGFDGYFETWYAGVSTDGEAWTKVKLQSTYPNYMVLRNYDVAAAGDSIGIFGSQSAYFGLIKSLDGGKTFSQPTTLSLGAIANLSAEVSGNQWLVMGTNSSGPNGADALAGYVSTDGMATWGSAGRPTTYLAESQPSVTVPQPGQFLVSYGQLQKASPFQLAADWDIKTDLYTGNWQTLAFVNSAHASDLPTINDSSVKMDSSPAGTVIATWSATVHLGDAEIFYARSEDGGITWNDAAPLNTDFADDTRHDWTGDIIHVGDNNWYALFTGLCSRSTDNGLTWSTPAPLTLPGQSLGSHTLAANHNGILFLANTTQDDTTLWRSTNVGESWNKVYTGPASFLAAHMVHTGAASWVYVGQQGSSGPLLLITENDGQTWESIPAPSGFSLAAMNQITSDHNGTLMAVTAALPFMTNPSEFQVFIARSTDNARTWELRQVYKTPFPFTMQRGFDSRLTHIRGTKWVTAWLFPEDVANFKDWHVWSSYSEDDGDTWDAAQQIGPHVDGDFSQEKINLIASNEIVIAGWNNVPNDEATTAPFGYDSDILITTASVAPVIIPEEPGDIAEANAGVKLNFKQADRDTMVLSGAIQISSGFSAAGKTVTVDAGGVLRSFILDAKGHAKVGNDTFALKLKSKKGFVPDQLAKFKLKIKKSSLSSDLQDEGMANANLKDLPVALHVNLQVDADAYAADINLSYTAKAGKTGKAK